MIGHNIGRHKNSKKARFVASIVNQSKVKIRSQNRYLNFFVKKLILILGISCQNSCPSSISSDYIYCIISTKNQKGKPCGMDLPLLKKISQELRLSEAEASPLNLKAELL